MRAPQSVQEYIEQEAFLLDEMRVREWLELFAPDAYYWIPAAEAQRHPLDGPSHVYEPKPVLAARVERLLDPRMIPAQPISRTVRVLTHGRMAGEYAGQRTIGVRTRFQLLETRVPHEAEPESRVFGGSITYSLRPRGESFEILLKRIDLLNAEAGLRGISILF